MNSLLRIKLAVKKAQLQEVESMHECAIIRTWQTSIRRLVDYKDGMSVFSTSSWGSVPFHIINVLWRRLSTYIGGRSFLDIFGPYHNNNHGHNPN